MKSQILELLGLLLNDIFLSKYWSLIIMIYNKIYTCLEKYLETVPSILYLPDTKEAASKNK